MKKLISLLLLVAMICCMLPASAVNASEPTLSITMSEPLGVLYKNQVEFIQ